MNVDESPKLLRPTREDPHDNPDSERLDRNVTDLLNELRVAGTGIQVMFAFLLVVPFNAGWKEASTFDKSVYFVALLCLAIAAVLLISPSVHHRLLFRQRERAYLVRVGTRLAIVAAAFLAVGLTAVLVLISNFVFGTTAAVVVGIAAAIVVSSVWFVLPLRRRSKAPDTGSDASLIGGPAGDGSGNVHR
ncbi:MAG TPA: DUF6328 family protein [Solirubrobacteraceae bacterium]|nr:DUF6328 family protein [Solirubrobacteraceae bacterium]